MIRKNFAMVLLLAGVHFSSFAQVTDAEKALRAQHADTTQGWRKDGKVDKTGGPKTQFKEILGVGIAYKF